MPRHRPDLGREHDPLAIESIRDHARDEAEEELRRHPRRDDEPEQDRRVGELEDQHRPGDLFHPHRGGTADLSEPEEAIVAILE